MPDLAATPPALPADVLDLFSAPDLLAAVLADAPGALALLRPLPGPDGGIADFQLELLSAAAQRLLGLPARPGCTYLEAGIGQEPLEVLDFYRSVYALGTPGQRVFSQRAGGTPGHLLARRVGAGLLVCFADAPTAADPAGEALPPESQIAEPPAQAAAERERAMLYGLLDQAPVAIGVLEGPELRITLANERMAALWGRPPAQLLGHPLLEAMPELHGQGFDALLQQVLASGVAHIGTEVAADMWRDGAVRTTYYNFVYQPLVDAQGLISGVVNMAIEVTGLVHSRQQVEARERQTQLLNQELAAANAGLQAANAGMQANNEALLQAQQAVQELNAELEQRVARRTHELSRALAETERQHEHLRQQRQALQQILEQVPAAVATLMGPGHEYSFFNARYQALVGGRAQLGRTVAECLPELVAQGMTKVLDEVFRSGEPFTGVERLVELHNPRTAQPTRRYLNFTYQVLPAAPDQPRSLLAFIVDNTDQVLSRERVAEANQSLTTANAALDLSNRHLTRTNADLDNFVYAASHDLKQPINNLLGLLDELRRTVAFADPDEGALLLPMIEEALHQLGTTIDDLAAVGQVQRAGNAPLETVDLADLTHEVLQALQPQVLAARARITTDFATAPTIRYSRANLRTILLNLISNSLKYADPARTARIHLSLWKENGAPLLLIEDNGLGFDVHRHQDELFQLFRRFHTHTEGTGVGLYLVNRIVQGNGGRVEVESEIGQGTTFRVYL